MANTPQRIEVSTGRSKNKGDDKKTGMVSFLIGAILGPFGLLFADLENKKSIVYIVSGWIFSCLIISSVTYVIVHVQEIKSAAIVSENAKELARIQQENSRIEQEEQEKKKTLKNQIVEEYNKMDSLILTIKELEGASEFKNLGYGEKDSLFKKLGIGHNLDWEYRRSDSSTRDVSRFASIDELEDDLRKVQAKNEKLITRIEKVNDYLAKCRAKKESEKQASELAEQERLVNEKAEQAKLNVQSDTSKKYIEDHMKDYNFRLPSYFMVHKYIMTRVGKIEVAESEFEKLKTAQKDEDAFLFYAAATSLLGIEKGGETLLPALSEVQETMEKLKAATFTAVLPYKGQPLQIAVVGLTGEKHKPLQVLDVARNDGSASRISFGLDDSRVYVIEKGAIGYLKEELINSPVKGGDLKYVLENKLIADVSYDVEKKRAKELAARKELEEMDARIAERNQEREKQKREAADARRRKNRIAGESIKSWGTR